MLYEGGGRSMAWLAGLLLLCAASMQGYAQSSARVLPPDPAKVLSQQVWALQTLHDLDLGVSQLEALREASPKLEEEPGSRVRSRVPARYGAALEALREALIREKESPEMSGRIDELRDDLESMREDEQVEIDDRVQIVDAARAAVPQVMKSLLPSQVAGYLAAYQDEIPDPIQSLTNAADQSRGLDEGKFNALAERTAKDVGMLAAGLDQDKADAAAARVRQWLTQNRELSNADYKAARPQLEKSARAMIGELDAFDVLRHWIERDVAELLSNPQLPAMIDERIKHAAK